MSLKKLRLLTTILLTGGLILSSPQALAESPSPKNDFSPETEKDYSLEPQSFNCLTRAEKETLQNCLDEQAFTKAQKLDPPACADNTQNYYIIGVLAFIAGAVGYRQLAK